MSLNVMKELPQGPIVIYFSCLYDSIRLRCFLSKFSIYGFLNCRECVSLCSLIPLHVLYVSNYMDIYIWYTVVYGVECSVLDCSQAKSQSVGTSKNCQISFMHCELVVTNALYVVLFLVGQCRILFILFSKGLLHALKIVRNV